VPYVYGASVVTQRLNNHMKIKITRSQTIDEPEVGEFYCHSVDPTSFVYLRIDTQCGMKALGHTEKNKAWIYALNLQFGKIAFTELESGVIIKLKLIGVEEDGTMVFTPK
jgi:hypothetical protein